MREFSTVELLRDLKTVIHAAHGRWLRSPSIASGVLS
jgi:hypothetical protein